MELSIKLYTIKSGWFIVYIAGLQVTNTSDPMGPSKYQKKNMFLSLTIDFVLAYSADPGEMSPYVAFYPGLHCLK